MIATTLPRGIVIEMPVEHGARVVVAERHVGELDGNIGGGDGGGAAASPAGGTRDQVARDEGSAIVACHPDRNNDCGQPGVVQPRPPHVAGQSLSRRRSAIARFSGRPSSTTTSPASKPNRARAAASARLLRRTPVTSTSPFESNSADNG